LPVGAITGQAIPVARVCPQPLNIPSASTIASPNLVTITSSTSTAISVSSAVNTNASSVQVQGLPTTGSVYIARPAQAHAVVPQISSGSGKIFYEIIVIADKLPINNSLHTHYAF
jgi:hypothetical protein